MVVDLHLKIEHGSGSSSHSGRRQIDMEIFFVDLQMSPLVLFECFLSSSGDLHAFYSSVPAM